MKIVCVIPARLSSTRFPRKVLALLQGRPLIERVYTKAISTHLFDEVMVATDSQEIADIVIAFGGKAHLTGLCASGTDRLIALQRQGIIQADIWVNWQADEPFVCKEILQDLLQTAHTQDADVWTLKKKITKQEEIHSPHTPKVVCDSQGYALYFSRSTIPYYSHGKEGDYFKHIGMYAFTDRALKTIGTLPPSPLEAAESLEQLRFLYGQMKIKVHETKLEVIGIDLPEHLVAAEALCK